MEEILHRLPITFELGLMALIVALIVGIPIGVYSAVAPGHGRRLRHALLRHPRAGAARLLGRHAGDGVPVDLVGLVARGEVHLRSPRIRCGTSAQLAIPALILGKAFSAVAMRLTRTMMLEVMRQDYIRTALAKGLATRTTIIRHALRNALIPVVTLVGLQAPVLVGGAVILEQIFVIPGMGLLLLEAVSQRDYPIITGVFLVVGVAVVLINLLVDLSYGLLDPKVRYR